MSKTARLYSDTRTATAATAASGSNLDKLNGELQDVTRIMTKNIKELLERGDSLESASRLRVNRSSKTDTVAEMSQYSTSLRSESERFKKSARNINLHAMLRQWAPVGGIGLMFLLLIWWKFF